MKTKIYHPINKALQPFPKFGSAIITIFCMQISLSVLAEPLELAEGVGLHQLDLQLGTATQKDSAYGLATIDFAKLQKETGMGEGFVNIRTRREWVVRNLPVQSESGYPGLGTMFDLGRGREVTELEVLVDFSVAPVSEFRGNQYITLPVGSLLYNAQGSHEIRNYLPTSRINLSSVAFQPGGFTDITWQANHPNIEQDDNQCGPAAVANSLQWLEDTYDTEVPHAHKAGVRDDSLVGELDKDMNRPAGGVVRSAKDFMEGKLQYITDNKLTDELSIKHKSRPGIDWLPTDIPAGNVPAGTAQSKVNTDANLSFFDWLVQELKAGEDVEVRIGWDGGGGHYIDLIGGGYVMGVPWIAWVHDASQGKEGGTSANDGGVQHSFVVENKLTAFINGKRLSGTIDYAVSESPVEDTGANDHKDLRDKISSLAEEGETGEIVSVASEFANMEISESSTFWEEINACGFYPQESRLECVLTIKQRFGYGGPVGAFGSFEHTLFCVDWNNNGLFDTSGALGSTESVGHGNVHMHDQPQFSGPPWHYAVYRDIDLPGGPRTTLSGLSTTTETLAPTLAARAILSWTFAPTNCNYVPIWGTVFDFRIRLDPIR